MTTTYYKEKVQKLQQEIDRQNEEIKQLYEQVKFLNNELLLSQESTFKKKEKNGDEIISKGNMSATIPPKFAKTDTNLSKILDDREKSIVKRQNNKNV